MNISTFRDVGDGILRDFWQGIKDGENCEDGQLVKCSL